jgi:FHA domain
MPRRPWHYVSITSILIILILTIAGNAKAQTGYTVILSVPDSSAFPYLTAFLDVHDPAGAFVHELTPQNVSMQENNIQVPVGQLDEQKNGVQFVVAISPGASFFIRDGLGITRYEYLQKALLEGTWADQPAGLDDYSLLTVGGPQITHTSDPAEIHSSIETYTPADPNATPSLEVLASALQVAADPTTRPGMERAVLFITPPQETDVSLGLQSIISSAVQQNIRVFVWLVAAPEVFDLPEIDPLRNLADQTHAAFFAFSHSEPVPDWETLLEPLRYIYFLGYDSRITSAGQQQLAAQVTIGNETFTSPGQSFEIDLQPPLPSLLALPAEIIRAFTGQPTPGDATAQVELVPTQQLLKIQVSFPDGYDRTLTRSSLFVDGTPVAENTAQPFDQFIWDLTPYNQNGEHKLSVEVVDNLGLVGKTPDTTVKIIVPTTTQNVIQVFSQKRPLLVGLIILISASILGLVLIIGGRIRPKPHPGQVASPSGTVDKSPRGGLRERLRQRNDPVTQPVKMTPNLTGQTTRNRFTWIDRLLRLRQIEKPSPAIAFLVPLVGSEEDTIPMPLEVLSDSASLGRDPAQSTLVINDPSINGLHAYLKRYGNSFIITDAGSVAGTWVNYEQVPQQGILLKHADIIHLGRVSFRIKLSEPGQPRKVVVSPLEPKR